MAEHSPSFPDEAPRFWCVTRCRWEGYNTKQRVTYQHTDFDIQQAAEAYAAAVRENPCEGEIAATVTPVDRPDREKRFRERQDNFARGWPLQVRPGARSKS
jgi:hypothetical protein